MSKKEHTGISEKGRLMYCSYLPTREKNAYFKPLKAMLKSTLLVYIYALVKLAAVWLRLHFLHVAILQQGTHKFLIRL